MLAAAHRILLYPFKRKKGVEKRERGEWYALTNQIDRVAELIPGQPRITALQSIQELPTPDKHSPLRYIVLDSGWLSYRDIIATLQQQCHERNRFLIYNPGAQVIISPQQIYTRS